MRTQRFSFRLKSTRVLPVFLRNRRTIRCLLVWKNLKFTNAGRVPVSSVPERYRSFASSFSSRARVREKHRATNRDCRCPVFPRRRGPSRPQAERAVAWSPFSISRGSHYQAAGLIVVRVGVNSERTTRRLFEKTVNIAFP